MFQNHLKIAFRNLLRYRLFSGINIVGLAASMSLGLVIIAMMSDLLRFDDFHEQKDSIYRIISHTQDGYRRDDRASTALPLAEQARSLTGSVEEVVRIRRYFGGEVAANEKKLPLNGYFADPSFLKIFSFPMLYGSPETALDEPFSIVITRKTMDKVFDGRNPVGEQMEVAGFGLFKVSGVLEDVPKFSHLQFEMLGSFGTVAALERQGKLPPSLESWDEMQFNYVYLLLRPNQSPEVIAKALNLAAAPVYQNREDFSATFSLQALTAILPGRDLSDQIGLKMEPLPLVILSGLALAVLLSACFNYTNLSLARAIRRSKEIGVRKVVGASRSQVFWQFLVEAIVVAFLALGLGISIFEFIKPGFLQSLPRGPEMLSLKLSPGVLLGFSAFAVLTGLLAGVAPALVLSKMNPANMVKNLATQWLMKRVNLRKALVVFQFVISLAFILAATIVWRQYGFALHHDMGFDKENMLNVSLQGADDKIVSHEFSKIPGVRQVSFSSLVPGTGSNSTCWVRTEEMQDSIGSYFMSVDANYLPNHQLKLLHGQNFPEKMPSAQEHFILVNEQFAKTFQWQPAEASGKVVLVEGQPHRITGVVKDFHYHHLEEPISSFFFRYQPESFAYANLKISSPDIAATMQALGQTWQKLNTGKDFQARFFDAQIEEAYDFLVSSMRIFGYLAMTAIAIACLGLLGMAVYTTETRLKEIGIRKVFGATEWQVLRLLSKGFVKMLLAAALVALPLTYYLFDSVILNQFAYRITIGAVELGTGVVLLLTLGLLMIGSQTWKAALANPVKSLRSE